MRKLVGSAVIFFLISIQTHSAHAAQAIVSRVTPDAHVRPSSPPNANSPLGTNLFHVQDSASEYVFLDAFKASRSWITQCMPGTPPSCTGANSFETGEESLLDLDANGWVTMLPGAGDPRTYRLVGTYLFTGMSGHYPAGQFIVLYEGAGTIEYRYDASFVSSSPGRDVITVTPTNSGIYMRITATTPGNYLRNIRVIVPGFESSSSAQIFHPDFLSRLQRYRVLRFLNWIEINGSPQSTWDSRAKMTSARWSQTLGVPAYGVPIEIMIALANRLTADAWFNIPHLATDDYVTQFATLARDTLYPGQNVYVEYSNEVWNDLWTQAHDIEVLGQTMWSTSPGTAFTKRMNYFGLRTAQICDIWKSVWGARSSNVKCVMGGRDTMASVGQTALDCTLWVQAPCYTHGINALAIGPYFGIYLGSPTFQSQVQSWNLDQLFAELNTGGVLVGGPPGGAVAAATSTVANNFSVANSYHLDLVAYEGGQLLRMQTNTTIANLFTAANRDARMGAAYDTYLAGWRAQGGTLFNHFVNVSQYGTGGNYGALEFLDQTSSPKYDALMRFIDNNPCWWTNCASTASKFFLPLLVR